VKRIAVVLSGLLVLAFGSLTSVAYADSKPPEGSVSTFPGEVITFSCDAPTYKASSYTATYYTKTGKVIKDPVVVVATSRNEYGEPLGLAFTSPDKAAYASINVVCQPATRIEYGGATLPTPGSDWVNTGCDFARPLESWEVTVTSGDINDLAITRIGSSSIRFTYIGTSGVPVTFQVAMLCLSIHPNAV
jgi:hypothetical protein